MIECDIHYHYILCTNMSEMILPNFVKNPKVCAPSPERVTCRLTPSPWKECSERAILSCYPASAGTEPPRICKSAARKTAAGPDPEATADVS